MVEYVHLLSTDGTVELLRELEKTTPGLKVVSEPDTGIYNALNKSARDAKGEWFYVLGCDDYISNPQRMEKTIQTGEGPWRRERVCLAKDGCVYDWKEISRLLLC